ncbi:MAG: dihydrofolate reductase family protein, partial [Cyanobacteriota bacterium]|nr:dihydrofolate reductase family protein [Cyanobacteriota bacterium]
RQGCVQELAAVVAPKLLGGAAARTPLADLGFERMDEVNELASISCRTLDCDWLIQGRLLD